jgi:hypothetical protein
MLFQRAMKETTLTGVSLDSMIRQPYSIALFRAGDVSAAKAQWRILQKQNVPIDSATREAIAGEYQTAFTDYARTLGHTSANPMFLDSGALYNLQRGLNAAAEAKYADAQTYLGYAADCSENFDAPHLALGVISAMKGEVTAADREWLKTLEGVVPIPPPPSGISQAQSDALTLLLHYN